MFSVTSTVLQHRIDSLKYEIAQYISGTDIDSIQILSKTAQENRGIYIKSLVDLENERLANLFSNFKTPVSTSDD